MRAAALGIVAYGAVQARGRLEPGLPVEGGVDPGRDSGGVGDEVVVDVAQAQLEPEVGGGHLVGRGEPAGRGRSGDLDVDRHVVAERALAAGLVDGGHHPTHVGGRVVGVAQRDLEAGDDEADPLRCTEGAGHLAGATGDDDGERGAEAADERHVGVAQHEGGDQVGRLPVAGGVRRGRLVDRRVARREDRRVVDEGTPLLRQRAGRDGCWTRCHAATLATR